jgi:hypothetical protein
VRPALLLLLLLPLEASSFVLAFLPSFKLSPEEKKSLEGKLSRRANAFLPQNRPAIAPFRRDRKKKINKSRNKIEKKINESRREVVKFYSMGARKALLKIYYSAAANT